MSLAWKGVTTKQLFYHENSMIGCTMLTMNWHNKSRRLLQIFLTTTKTSKLYINLNDWIFLIISTQLQQTMPCQRKLSLTDQSKSSRLVFLPEAIGNSKASTTLRRGHQQYSGRRLRVVLILAAKLGTENNQRSLYGLKQAPGRFFNFLTERILKHGLRQSLHDPCLFMDKNMIVIVLFRLGTICNFLNLRVKI